MQVLLFTQCQKLLQLTINPFDKTII